MTDIAQITGGVLTANLFTAMLIYGVYRYEKGHKDAIIMIVAPLLLSALAFIAFG